MNRLNQIIQPVTASARNDVVLRTHTVLQVPEAEHWGHWEGRLEIEAGVATGGEISFVADLMILADQIGGTGCLSEQQADVSLTGERRGHDVNLLIYIDFEPFAREPFYCYGSLTSDGSEINGDFEAACYYPDTCGCDGHFGSFELVRLSSSTERPD